jgi:flagellar biosynthetic protein FliQ
MLIGLVQALTSIQELTLTFVPKLVAVMATLWATADIMAAGLTTFLKRDLVPLMLGM